MPSIEGRGAAFTVLCPELPIGVLAGQARYVEETSSRVPIGGPKLGEKFVDQSCARILRALSGHGPSDKSLVNDGDLDHQFIEILRFRRQPAQADRCNWVVLHR